MTDAAALLGRMVDELSASGELVPAWHDTFLSVLRHAFIPEVIWRHDANSDSDDDLVPLRRGDDPDGWLDLAYADDAVITQVDDGRPVGPGLLGREISSSASQPRVVAQMLAALDVAPGMTVLEIGTGTGYNAALLAHRVGAENVTTVEIDPQLATAAAGSLRDAGYGGVTCVTGDGALGHPERAPYDRIIATACVYRPPFAWIEQLRPGGRLLTPWRTEYYNGGLLALTATGDGTAEGGIVSNVAFMMLRDQRNPRASVKAIVHATDEAAASTTNVHPYRVAGHPGAAFTIGVRVPQCRSITWPPDPETGAATVWFLDQWSRSWARLDYVPDAAEYAVHQFGSRRLWDEVEAAYHWWLDAGSPDPGAWRFTINPTGHHLSLED